MPKSAGSNASAPVFVILLLSIGLAVAIYTFATFASTSTMTGLSGDANTTWQAIISNVYSGYQLLGISVIVVAAGSLIGYLYFFRA